MHKLIAGFTCLACLALAACGGSSPPPTTDVAAPPTEAPVATVPEQVTPASTPEPTVQNDTAANLGTADIEAYVRGMQKELELLAVTRDKADQARAAKDTEAEAMAMMEGASGEIDRAGADAAGLDPARYGFVKNTIDTIIMSTVMKESASGTAAEMFDQRVREEYTRFEPDAAKMMESRLAELTKLHNDVLATRVKIAG